MDAFVEYFAARVEVVRRTAYLLCGDWNWAEDLTQTTFVRLAASWHKIRDRGALDAFTRTCLLRVYLSDAKRIWRRREHSVAYLPDVAVTANHEESVTRRLLFAKLLHELPPRQRAVLICRYYHDLDIAATAAALNCSEGTVKSQTSRALAKLRTLLGESAIAMGETR
jgi:RNA polymerase sigma-70 factor (sigma-E family)